MNGGGSVPGFDLDRWELYQIDRRDSARRTIWPPRTRRRCGNCKTNVLLAEAAKYNMLPLDDRTGERLRPDDGGATDPDPR